MARARNIKPGLFKNEVLGVADPFLTLLFESLWCLADREGRLEDRPLRIKAETFPYREGLDVDALLNELQTMGFIQRYSVKGQLLIAIVNFKKHQTPHNTEKPSELPAPLTEGLSLDNAEVTEAKRSDSLNTDSFNPPTESLNTGKRREEFSPEFETAWQAYPERPGMSKKDAYKAWNARLKDGSTAADMMDGVMRYAAYVKATDTQPQYVKQPTTFFGPGEHYKANWKPPPKSRGSPTKEEKGQALLDRIKGNRNADPDIIDIN